MAEAKLPSATNRQHNYRQVTWTLGQDQEGEPESDIWEFGTKTIQVAGDFAGARLDILGEILAGKFDGLNDSDTIPMSFTIPGLKTTDDLCARLKPKVEGGTENTKILVAVLMKR